MSDESIKTLVLELLREAREQEQTSIAGLSAAEREATGTWEEWSAKDTISQIAFWKRLQTGKLRTALRGEPLPVWNTSEVVDPLNRENYAKWQQRPWDVISAEAESAYGELSAQVRGMTEAELTEDRPDGGTLWLETLGNGIWYPYSELIRLAHQRGDTAGEARVVAARIAGNERLLAALRASGASDHRIATYAYNLACYCALAGIAERAIGLLGEAFRLRHGLMTLGMHDSDLDSLRGLPAFQALYAGYVDDSAETLIARETVHERQRDEAAAAPILVDVRNPAEYAAGHIAGAVNIPLHALDARRDELPQGRLVVTYCNHQHRGVARCEQAVDVLRQRGYDARALDGGYPQWRDAGLPVVEPAVATVAKTVTE